MSENAGATRVAVKQALVAAITAASDLHPPYGGVTFGRPGATITREGVAVTDVTGSSEVRQLSAGRKRRADRFTIDVRVWAFASAQATAVAAELRCAAIAAVVENVLADDPTLGGVVRGLAHVVLVDSDGPDSNGDHDGWYANAVLHVECLAHLT